MTCSRDCCCDSRSRSSELKGDLLEGLSLRRVAVDDFGQPYQQQIVDDRQRERADHCTRLRCDAATMR